MSKGELTQYELILTPKADGRVTKCYSKSLVPGREDEVLLSVNVMVDIGKSTELCSQASFWR